MKRASTFLVSQYFGRWLVSRRGAVQLLRKAKSFDLENTSVQMNFSGVAFISRSFADQLLKCIDSTKTDVTFLNPNSSITKLLEATRKNYKSERRRVDVFYPHYTVRNKEEYFEKLGIE